MLYTTIENLIDSNNFPGVEVTFSGEVVYFTGTEFEAIAAAKSNFFDQVRSLTDRRILKHRANKAWRTDNGKLRCGFRFELTEEEFNKRIRGAKY